MTTAHRPTFDPARGKEALRGPAYHQRLLPAHTQLKYRKPGQGGAADRAATDDDDDDNGSESRHDLRADLLAAEAAHYSKKHGGKASAHIERGCDDMDAASASVAGMKRPLGTPRSDESKGVVGGIGNDEEEDLSAKRRRILEETRDIDADSSGSEHEEDDEDDDDDSDDDEEAELQREMERIRRERAEKRAKEEEERLKEEEDARMRDIALGNPLLNKQEFGVKRRWDDDVVFKNQARGTEVKKPKEFTNDMLRSDFHKRFMHKYVR